MKITIKEPVTGTEMQLDAQPEDYNGEQGLRIIFPEKDSFVIVQKNGDWEVMDDDNINPEIVKSITEALHPRDRYTSLT